MPSHFFCPSKKFFLHLKFFFRWSIFFSFTEIFFSPLWHLVCSLYKCSGEHTYTYIKSHTYLIVHRLSVHLLFIIKRCFFIRNKVIGSKNYLAHDLHLGLPSLKHFQTLFGQIASELVIFPANKLPGINVKMRVDFKGISVKHKFD